MDKAPSSGCSVLTHDFHGAATKVAPEATAFGLRTPHLMLELVAQIHPSAGDRAAELDWVRQTKERTAHLRLPGGYPNMMSPEDGERVQQAYGPMPNGRVQSSGALIPKACSPPRLCPESCKGCVQSALEPVLQARSVHTGSGQ